ncbi:hypothetical protein LEP1GSC192_1973 [Leptospira sp. B5-022]|nr:hypothetical protein LEP1GSC192_1973 [Leptospira sp. B5-022]
MEKPERIPQFARNLSFSSTVKEKTPAVDRGGFHIFESLI